MSHDLVEIARFQSAAYAGLARILLEEAGIAARLDGEAMASWFCYFGSSIGGVRLLVSEEDAHRASEVLSAKATIDDDAMIDFGDDSPEDEQQSESEQAEELTRALRASIIGIFLLPPLLNIYSMYLIVRHQLIQFPLNWKITTALAANGFVFLLLGILVAMVTAPHEQPPTIYGEDGTPPEVHFPEEAIPITGVP